MRGIKQGKNTKKKCYCGDDVTIMLDNGKWRELGCCPKHSGFGKWFQ